MFASKLDSEGDLEMNNFQVKNNRQKFFKIN